MNKKYFAIANSNYEFPEKKTEVQSDWHLRITKAGHIEINPITISNMTMTRNTSTVRSLSGHIEFVPGIRDVEVSLKLNRKYFSYQDLQFLKCNSIVDVYMKNHLWSMLVQSITENTDDEILLEGLESFPNVDALINTIN